MAEKARRRGAALEEAILDAGWDQLMDVGYPGFTVESIAERAKTGKAALYRRWPDKDALLVAVIAHRHHGDAFPAPDTGSLRGDVLSILRGLNERVEPLAALFSTVLGSYYEEQGTTPAEIRVRILEGRDGRMGDAVNRAIERGEIPGPVSRRIEQMPLDLVRHDVMMNLRRMDDDALVEIVDELFLPLVGGGVRGGVGEGAGARRRDGVRGAE